MLITCGANFIQHQLVHLPGQIIIGLGPHAATNLIGERRAFMRVQQIKRQVVGPQFQSFVEISLPARQRLIWQSGDQIKIHVLKSGIAQLLKGRADIIRIMRSAKQFQFSITKSLRAETGAIDSEVTQVLKEFAFGTSPHKCGV